MKEQSMKLILGGKEEKKQQEGGTKNASGWTNSNNYCQIFLHFLP